MKVATVLPEIVSNPFFGGANNQAVADEDKAAKTFTGKRFAESDRANPLKDVDSALTAVKPIVNGLGLRLEFSQDVDTKIRVIKVIDLESGEVIRQIPPQETVAFLRQLRDSKEVFVSLRL